MKFVALSFASAALVVAFSPLTANAQYEYGGGCCSCVPTSSPTTGFPTVPPTPATNVDTVCDTDGGYAPEDSKCVTDFTYQSKTGSVKRSGCQSMVGKYRPYIDPVNPPPLPTEGGDASMWCPTVAIYSPSKKKTKNSWGYCNCIQLGCLPDTVTGLLGQAVNIYKLLTPIQQQKFKAVTKTDNTWITIQPLSYSGANSPPCYTDGGKTTNAQCQATWTYVSSTGVSTPVTGCADTNSLKPYTTGTVIQPTISSTSKSKYCSIVSVYDSKKTSTTKDEWGYCSCLTNLDIAAVNSLISTYNPLTYAERDEFWAAIKSS